MRPEVWQPPVEPSPAEQAVMKAVRRAKLFVFLRQHRHELFDEAFQAELAQMYVDSEKGQPPVPPAQLALATILQAYTGVSDDEVIEVLVMDRRWQLVLDCLDTERAPFSKGTLVGFRTRLIAADLDRRLIERTVELAAATKGFGARALRAALDSSPLWGAGRVEDTINLMGHALRKALGVIAVVQGWGQAEGTAVVAEQAGVPALAASSLKAALDLDWDDPATADLALAQVLEYLNTVEGSSPACPVTRLQPKRLPSLYRCVTRTSTCPGARPRCAAGWLRTGGSASRTTRCGMAASPGRCGSTDTSATSCGIWPPAWYPRSG
jgi:transposase